MSASLEERWCTLCGVYDCDAVADPQCGQYNYRDGRVWYRSEYGLGYSNLTGESGAADTADWLLTEGAV